MESFYKKYLSKIHDTNFSFFAEGCSNGILEVFKIKKINKGHIVDLGCGSGVLVKVLYDNGYSVTGIDQSPHMISIAREKVPNGNFIVNSFYSCEIPPCSAVTATGECFNYLFDKSHSLSSLRELFKRIFSSLDRSGLFIFDFAMPGRVRSSTKKRWNFDSFSMNVEHVENDKDKILTRNIKLGFQTNNGIKEDKETHRLRLFKKEELEGLLVESGFTPEFVTGFGSFQFPFEIGYGGFIAEKNKN